MTENMLFETLKKLQPKQERLPPMDYYMDENTGEIKSRPIPSDMAASAIHKIVKHNQAKELRDILFH